MRILRLLALALLMLTFSLTASHAAGETAGPAQQAAERWFAKTHRGVDTHRVQVFSDKNGQYAVGVVDYSPQGGHALLCAVGVFRKESTGSYAFVKEAKPSDGIYGETENVTFKGNTAVVSAKVRKPGDPNCCPTGKKTWKFTLP